MPGHDAGSRPVNQSVRDEKYSESIKSLVNQLKKKDIFVGYKQCGELLQSHDWDIAAAFEEAIQPDFKIVERQTKKAPQQKPSQVYISFTNNESPKQVQSEPEPPQQCTIEIAPEPEIQEKAPPQQPAIKQPVVNKVYAQPVPVAPQAPQAPQQVSQHAVPTFQNQPFVPAQQGFSQQYQLPPLIPFTGPVCFMPVPPNFQMPPGYVLVVPVSCLSGQ